LLQYHTTANCPFHINIPIAGELSAGSASALQPASKRESVLTRDPFCPTLAARPRSSPRKKGGGFRADPATPGALCENANVANHTLGKLLPNMIFHVERSQSGQLQRVYST
jgi:hypothetical protein